MKFGKRLLENQVEEWSAHYIDYKRLKRLLGPLFRQYGAYAPLKTAAEKVFFEGLRKEADKVELFYMQVLGDLKTEFQNLILLSYAIKQQRSAFSSSLLPRQEPTSATASPKPSLHDICQRLHQLINTLQLLKANYLALNRLAIKKIVKKHDKIVGAPATNADLEELRNSIFSAIETRRAFWTKGRASVGELLEEAQNFQLELGKMTVRHYHDMIP